MTALRTSSLRVKVQLSPGHPLAAEFEEQMVRLVKEFKGDRQCLSVHHPEGPNEYDDAPDKTALQLLASVSGKIGEILFA